jgi:hypothetical protein
LAGGLAVDWFAESEAKAVPAVKLPTNAHPAHNLPWTIAAPSCVLPAPVAENCTFLAPRFDEIGLAFFETEASLAYTGQDLPPGLASLPVSWHVHLPLDLPWAAGVDSVASAVLGLARMVDFLSPGFFVLHPPGGPQGGGGPNQLAKLARLLTAGGIRPEALLVENINGRDLALHWPVITDLGLGVCLDLGHMLVHGQEDFLDLPGLAERMGMVHLNAPDPLKPSRHASLSLLDAHGRALMARLLGCLAPGGVVVLELFNEAALADSLGILHTEYHEYFGEKEART